MKCYYGYDRECILAEDEYGTYCDCDKCFKTPEPKKQNEYINLIVFIVLYILSLWITTFLIYAFKLLLM